MSRSTIWQHESPIYSGPVETSVLGNGTYSNIISYGGGGEYPVADYTACSVVEGDPLPPGQNAAQQGFTIELVYGVKTIVIVGAGGGGGGGTN